MTTKHQRKAKKRNAERARNGNAPGRRGRWVWIAWVIIALVGVIGLGALLENERSAVASPIEFTDVKAHTREFMGYYEAIEITPEQEQVKRQALTAIKAPCCSDNTAYTCCCPCNMAKTWWGLANHLIANEGYGADEVQAAVEGWIEFINPKGFSGEACYTGGCARPFHRDGCGGMDQRNVVF